MMWSSSSGEWMASEKMHADEVGIDEALVGRLIGRQFPAWAGLPLERVRPSGTDNALFRLGRDLAVRLPRHEAAAGQVAKEQRWLKRLAPHLPLAIPVPVAQGEADAGYPYRWSVCRWIEGDNALTARIDDLDDAARALAGFVDALQGLDATEGPRPGPHNSFRGVPLAQRDGNVRAAIGRLDGLIDTGAALGEWEAALAAPGWERPPVWLHGDIHPGNLIVSGGKLGAVIDFGCLGVGDPACDLMPAWTLLTADTREIFRAALAIDDATWARGRGWALSAALIALPYYLDTNPTLVAISRRAIAEILG
jgi:aminoglycoside phosphotransferase (APT) family kinase protein